LGDVITSESTKDVLSHFVFISVIHYASLGNAGRPVRGCLSRMANLWVRTDSAGRRCSAVSSAALAPRRTSWRLLESRAESHAALNLPSVHTGGCLECYSAGLFSNCCFERKPECTIEPGTARFPLVQKQDAAKRVWRAAWGVPQELL